MKKRVKIYGRLQGKPSSWHSGSNVSPDGGCADCGEPHLSKVLSAIEINEGPNLKDKEANSID